MKIQRMPEDIVPLLNDLVRRLTALETRPLGTVFINESLIIKDPDTGVETIIGDLHGEGEDRHGIKQWVGDTTPPPIPTSPMVSANLGVFSVAWDGDSKDGIAQAPDFDHINVYGNNGNSTMLVGVIKTKDEVAIVTGAEYNVPWTFWFTSVDFNGNESAKSDDSLPISVTPLVEELDMKEILDDINERYDGVITEAERLNDVLADAEQTITETKTGLNTLKNTTLPQVEARIDAAHQDLVESGAELDSRLVQAEIDLNTAEEGLNTLKNTTIPAVKAQIEDVHQELVTTGGQLDSRLDQAESDLNTAEASLNTLKNTTLPALNQRLAEAETEITETGQQLDARLDQAEIDLDTAEAGLNTLKNTDLPALKLRLTNAETEITETGQQLDERLDDAFIQIGTVDAKAIANATAASTAQSAADTANSAAASAAGIANGKGKVLVQSTAPVAADRNAVTLWIDTTGGANTPKRWTTGTTWVAVTDKAATDAAQAAATAQSKADLAHTNAGAAQTTANNALTMAGSKNSVFYSTSTPSGTASLGDTWRRVNSSGDVIGEWRWSASNSWVSQQVTTEMISNLDVGKLTAGSAKISDLVVEKLWAEVIRAKKITTDQLLVGQGTNFLADPDFDDPVINTLRVGGRPWNTVKHTTYGNGFATNSATTADFPLWNENAGRFSVEPDGVYALTIYANGPDQLQAYLNCFYEDGYSNSGPTIRKFEGINGGAPKKYTVTWDMSTLHSPDGAPVKEINVNIRRLSTPAGQTSFYNNIYSAWFGRMTDGALIVTGSITADHIESVSVAAELAEFINLDVSRLVASNAKISDLVVEKLWAEVIRAKKITTDQLLVGSGSNLIVDPYFEDETIKAFRHASASTMQGGWGRNSATNLNWYGGTQTTGASTFYFNTIASRTSKDGMIPIVAGDKFRFNFLYNSGGGGARPIVQMVKTDGTSVITATGFTVGGVSTASYGSAGSGQTLEAVWTPPADAAYFLPGFQWETSVTSAHIYGGASVQNMADGNLIVSGSIDADKINTNSIVAEVAKFIELDVSKLVSTNATINTAVIEKLWAEVIRSRKITTDQLLVGQGENLIPYAVNVSDPKLRDSSNIVRYGGSGPDPAISGGDSVTGTGYHVIMNADWVSPGVSMNTWRIQASNKSAISDYGFITEPEEEFSFTIYAKAGGSYASGMPTIQPSLVWYKPDGTYISTVLNSGATLTWSWNKIEVSGKAPATAGYVVPFIRQNQPGNIRIDLPSLYRKKGASLIVDGSIAAKQIDSESVSAEVAKFINLDVSRLVATNATINTAVVNKLWTDVIRSRKITTDMMVVGSGGNHHPDPTFTDPEGWSSSSYIKTGVGRNGGNGLIVPASTGQSGTYYGSSDRLRQIPVIGGQEYRVGVWVKSSVAIPLSKVTIYVKYTTPSSSTSGTFAPNIQNTGVDGRLGVVPANTWRFLEGITEMPDTAEQAFIGLYAESGFNAAVTFSEPSVQTASGTGLIVDGAIEAKHITASEKMSAKLGEFLKLDVKDLVTTGSAKINEAVITKLWSDVVMSKKITADMMVIGGTNNLIPNANVLTDLAGWESSTANVVRTVGASGPDATTPYMYVTNRGNIRSTDFEVSGGNKFRFKIKAQASVTGTRIFVQLNNNGTGNPYIINNQALTTTWDTYSGEVELPEDATKASINIYVNHVNGGLTTQRFAYMSLIQMASGELIVDGAITALKIKANAVESDKIKANAITADKIDVGAIKAEHISARGITADKLVVGDGSNVFPDSFMKDLDSWNAASNVTVYTGGYGGGNRARVNGVTGQAGGYYAFGTGLEGRRPDVIPGRSYLVSCYVKPTVAVSSTSAIALYSRVYKKGDPHTASYSFTTPNAPVYNGKALAANVWTEITGQITIPAGDETSFMPGLYLQATFPSTGACDFSMYTLTEMVTGELVVKGAITTDKLKSDAIDGMTITGALIQTDNSANKGIKLKNEGLEVYSPEGEKTLSITAGQGVDYIGIWGHENAVVNEETGTLSFPVNPDTGSPYEPEQVATITAKGELSGKSLEVNDLSVAETLQFSGEPMDGHGSGNHGPTIMGRDLLGATYTDFFNDNYGESGSAWLTPLPHGLLSNSYHNGWSGASGSSWSVEGNPGKVQVLTHVRDTVEIKNGRGYLITYTTPAFKSTDGKAGSPGAAVVKYTTGRTLGVDAGSTLHGSRYYISGSSDFDNPGRTIYAVGGQDLPVGDITLGVEVYVYDGRRIESTGTADARYWSINILDVGSAFKGNTGNVSSISKKVPAAPTSPPVVDPPPAPKPPAKKTYTKTWNASWWATYWVGNGDGINSGMKSPKVAQGKPPGVSYRQRGAIGFPNMLGASDLNGVLLGDLKKVEVYVYASHWYSSAGGTLEIGTHGHTSKPSTMSVSLVTNRKSQSLKKPEGRWVTLPSSVHSGLLSGSVRGIQAYTTSTSLSKYGYLDGKKSKIRVTYAK